MRLMNDRISMTERRLDRRIPLGCAATIRLRGGDTIPAKCVEISVGGMTLHAAYVPGETEIIEVVIKPPGDAASHPPLVTRLEVKRCHSVGNGVYEIGGTTLRVVG
jgi:hypothetical protein